MATEKLYYQDAHQAAFEARVVSCQPGKHGYDVVLDRTCFYPEGGGQPGDTGFLSGVRVTDTHERGGEIVHFCEQPLSEGQSVEGRIDYTRRFEFMQLHSGEHILSGVVHRRFGYENVGFHMGADFVTIDFSGMLTQEDLSAVEAEANEWVWKNVPIEITYPDAEALKTIPYRSKKELTGQVRITQFPGADMCACCGTHVSRSGQVGLVKFIGWQNFRDGVRLELLCGQRALAYLSLSWQQNSAVGRELSVKPDKTAQAVERLLGEVQSLKARCAGLEEAEFHRLAEEHRGAGNVLLVQPPMEPDSVRRLCDALSRTCSGRCAVFAGTDGGYKYAVIHPEQDITPFMKAMNAALRGRGGGRDGFAQGSAACTEEEIRRFWAENT